MCRMVFWLCYTFVYSIPKVKKQTFSKLIMYESVATNTTPFVAPIYLSIFLKETKKNFFYWIIKPVKKTNWQIRCVYIINILFVQTLLFIFYFLYAILLSCIYWTFSKPWKNIGIAIWNMLLLLYCTTYLVTKSKVSSLCLLCTSCTDLFDSKMSMIYGAMPIYSSISIEYTSIVLQNSTVG